MLKALLLDEYSLSQWVLVFFLCSFIGWCWEVAIYLVKERRFVNRGFLHGPILPIYGFGAVTILVTCLPFKSNIVLVGLVGTLAASLLELVTGMAMEGLFHVRYWDYSNQPLNFHGYICLMSAATWAVFAAVLVCVVHPFIQPFIRRIPPLVSGIAAAGLTVYGVADVIFAVRRALDLRSILEGLERYAKEMESLHGGLDSISDRIEKRIRAHVESVEEKQEAFAAWVDGFNTARTHMAARKNLRNIYMETSIRERLAAFEKNLAEASKFLPDTGTLTDELSAFKEKHDRLHAQLRQRYESRLNRAQKSLRGNPSASSRRYNGVFETLKKLKEDDKKDWFEE